MKRLIGNFATILMITGAAHFAFAPAALATEPVSSFEPGPVEKLVSDTLVGISENEPQASIGFVIGQICPSGTVINDADFQARCNEVAGAALSDNNTANGALQAMAPEEDAVIASSQVDSGSAQIDNIGDRLSSLRGGGGGGLVFRNSSGFNWSTGAAGDGMSSPWGFFVNGLYVTSDRDSTSRESGFTSDDFGVTAGIDYTFSDRFVLGFAFGYKDSDADIDANGGDLESDSYSYFAYWSLYPNENWYIDAMAGYTENDHDQTRNVIYTIGGPGTGLGAGSNTISNAALSSTESEEFSVSVTAGRNYFLDAWTLSPYGRIDYADIEIDGFNERMAQTTALGSGLALQIDDQDFDSLMMTLGASATTQWGERYFPQVSVEYVHEFKNNNDPITGRFLADTSGTTFALLTDRPDRNFFNVGAAMTAVLTDSMTGFFRYQGLFGYEDLEVHAFEVGVRVGF